MSVSFTKYPLVNRDGEATFVFMTSATSINCEGMIMFFLSICN